MSKKMIFIILFFSLILIVFFISNCRKNAVGLDSGEFIIRLQNQTDHSGIMVKLIETGQFTITDSLGHFTFDKLTDGFYTLEAKYPFFCTEQIKLWVIGRKLKCPTELELKQQLQFWIEPAETTVSMNNLGDPNLFAFDGMRQYRVNITDVPVSVATLYSPLNPWAFMPQVFDWPFVSNSENRPDFCYDHYGWLGCNDIPNLLSTTFLPGDTTFRIVPKPVPQPGNLLLRDCFIEGKYLFYSVTSDFVNYPEYFDAGYFWVDTLSQPQPYNNLTKTLFKKRDLLRPAIVTLTN